MVRLLAALLLLGALSAEAQLQTQPTGLKKMDGSDSGSGGGSGTGFVCDAGACVFQASTGDEIEINSDSTYLNDEAGNSIFGVTPTGALTYVQAQLVGTAKELRDITTRSTTGTFTGTNILCSTGAGAVVGTLDADAATNGRFVYITRSGANTCTIGVESGHTLDGVTDGTTTIANGGSKTFKQSGDTAWITTTEYPVTGTLSGLTAGKLILATGAAAGADSAITHNSTTGTITGDGTAPYLALRDHGGTASYGKLWWDGTAFVFVNNAESDTVGLTAKLVSAATYITAATYLTIGDSVALIDDGHDAASGMWLKDGAMVSWPAGPTRTQAYTQTGLQISQSKALVDATATAFSRVAVASNSYEGGVLHYTIFATDATDYQNRSGSVPFAVRNLGGTETCTFGTASDAYDGTGTLTVTFDCAAGTDTVDLRANANTSLASTTIFTIQARVDLTSGTATVTPQ